MRISRLACAGACLGLVMSAPVPAMTATQIEDTFSRVDSATDGFISSTAAGCPPAAVLFARGTTEPAPFGLVIGPAFMESLKGVMPPGTVYIGVKYPADIPGYLIGGSPIGIADMKLTADSIVASCPGIKLVLSGYSQGAQITHKAMSVASTQTQKAVKAVVMFGDPNLGVPMSGISQSDVLTRCNIGDTICTGAPIITPAHLVYIQDAGKAARFVGQRMTKVSGT